MKLVAKTFFAFAIVVVLFAVSLAITFGQLFQQTTLSAFKSSLETRAKQLATAFYRLEPVEEPCMLPRGRGQGSFQAGRQSRVLTDYLHFFRAQANEDIWLIDETGYVLVTPDSRLQGRPVDRPFRLEEKALPANALEIIDRALSGETVLTEYFSSTLGVTAITAGTPLQIDQETSGVLLLHAPVTALTDSNKNTQKILFISIVAGLLLAAIAAYLFSQRLSSPLKKMQTYAKVLASGDYEKRLEIDGNDEIADLGQSLDTLGLRLKKADKEAAHSLKVRQDFLATVSHELKTPVTVLRGLVEAMHDGVIEDSLHVREQMLAETTQLDRLIRDLLELSRLQQNDFVLTTETLSINQVLEDAVRSIGAIASKKAVNVSLQTAANEKPFAGDYGRIKQMFLAVLDNAVRVSPPEGTVLVRHEDDTVTIEDEGKGIPEAELPHLFDRYYQGASKGSSGLGLTIAEAIATKHAIQIEVESRPGKTVFRFSLS